MARKKRVKPHREPRRFSLRWFEKYWAKALGNANPKLAEAVAELCVQNRKLAKHVQLLEEALGEMQADMHSHLHRMGEGLSKLEENQVKLTGLMAVSPLQLSDLPRWLKNDGLVSVKGTPHLRECAKVKDEKAEECTCGSVPSKRSN